MMPWLLLSLAVIAAICGVLVFGRRPRPLAPESASADMLAAGPHAVAVRDVRLVDATRAAAALDPKHSAPSRRLKTRIWHPRVLEAGAHPLVVFVHGFSSGRTEAAFLARHLASHGYVVAAADHPLTHVWAPGGPRALDVINQPGDVSFLIDTLLDGAAEPVPGLARAIDPRRIGVMGISLGGMTATLAAFDPRRRDPRLAAAISIAGPSVMFARRWFEHAAVPFMMVAADQDALIAYADNARDLLERCEDAVLVTVRDGSHTGFSGRAGSLRWLSNPDLIGCFIVRRRGAAREEAWYGLLGAPEHGVVAGSMPAMCEHPLPRAMNPLHQQRITRLAVWAFLQSRFAADPQERERHAQYLLETLPRELREVAVAAGPAFAVAGAGEVPQGGARANARGA